MTQMSYYAGVMSTVEYLVFSHSTLYYVMYQTNSCLPFMLQNPVHYLKRTLHLPRQLFVKSNGKLNMNCMDC